MQTFRPELDRSRVVFDPWPDPNAFDPATQLDPYHIIERAEIEIPRGFGRTVYGPTQGLLHWSHDPTWPNCWPSDPMTPFLAASLTQTFVAGVGFQKHRGWWSVHKALRSKPCTQVPSSRAPSPSTSCPRTGRPVHLFAGSDRDLYPSLRPEEGRLTLDFRCWRSRV